MASATDLAEQIGTVEIWHWSKYAMGKFGSYPEKVCRCALQRSATEGSFHLFLTSMEGN